MSVNQTKVLKKRHTGRLNQSVKTAINNIKKGVKAQRVGVKESFSRNQSMIT